MTVLEYARRPIWLWIFGILGALVLIVISTYVMTGTPTPGRLATQNKDELETLHNRRPRDNEVAYYYAHALMMNGDNAKAYEVMADVVAREPRSTRYLLRFAHFAATRGRARETIDVFRRIVALDPGDANAHSEIGQVLTDAGLMTEALQEFDQALKLDPKVPYDPLRYAQCLTHAGRNEEAWRQLEGTIIKIPLQDAAYELLGTVGAKLGRYNDAEEWLIRRVGMDMEYPSNRYQYALARLALARPRTAATLKDAEAWALLSTQKNRGTWEMHPVKADYFALYANILQLRGRFAEARAALLSGLKLEPVNKECLQEMVRLCEHTRDPKAGYWRTALNKSAGETEQMAALRHAVEAKPSDLASMVALAAEFARKERYTEAEDLCVKALRLAPNDPSATETLQRLSAQALKRLEVEARKKYDDLDPNI